MGARRDGLPEATAAAAGASKTVGLINQPSVSIRQASVPASGCQLSMAPPERSLPQSRNDISHLLPRSSNDNSRVLTLSSDENSQTLASSQSRNDDSQPLVVVQGDRTLSSTRSDDIFGPLSPAYQDSVLGIDSPSAGDQQQDDAQQGQIPGGRQRYPELRLDHPVHTVQQEALEHHPELKIRVQHATIDASDNSGEELALMNIPEGTVIPTFLTMAAKETEPFEPKTLHQAKNDASWLEWERAMLDEVNSLKQNRTWELIDPPKNHRILSGKWVFKLKRGPQGEVIRHKSRWVVGGFRQQQGIDYDETFAPVVKPMSYKALFAIAAALDLEFEQMDVKIAFLYGDIDHEIYVE